tara:strand:- start:2398 stop:2745 length:348 start_codon:yes stop_codon:yes gene_type:complete
MTIADDFDARFPGFDTTIRTTYFTIVEAIWAEYYCFDYTDETQEAILNLIAHLMLLESDPSNEPQHVKTSQSAGSVSVSFQAGDDSVLAQFYSTTKYGQRFWQLVSLKAGGGFFV